MKEMRRNLIGVYPGEEYIIVHDVMGYSYSYHSKSLNPDVMPFLTHPFIMHYGQALLFQQQKGFFGITDSLQVLLMLPLPNFIFTHFPLSFFLC